ncbi:MAG: ABC transporter ATP-binding protein [Myxococcota bacterium]
MQIEIRNLSKRFGRVEALRGVSLEIPTGRRVAIVGPNGSGKSTLNRALLGLLAYDGEVRIGGFEAFRERRSLAARTAYVPQLAPALAAPVGDWVRLVAELRGLDPAQIEKTARGVGLDLTTLRERPFRALSGGMRQKLLIALALAAPASLVVLDEPTGSLDAQSRERVLALVDALPRDTTVLLCSHRLSEIRALVDEVLVLAEGRVSSHGPVRNFLDEALVSVLEVAADDEAAPWLEANGFRRAPGGWWTRPVTREEKIEMLARLPDALAGQLRDVAVREAEALALPEAGDGEG